MVIKSQLTFSDVLGATGRRLWKERINQPAVAHRDVEKPSTTIGYLHAKVRSLEQAPIAALPKRGKVEMRINFPDKQRFTFQCGLTTEYQNTRW